MWGPESAGEGGGRVSFLWITRTSSVPKQCKASFSSL